MNKNTENLLVEGIERLGLLATRIRQEGFSLSAIEKDVILEELRNLYKIALQASVEEHTAAEKEAARKNVEEAAVRKVAEEAAARKAAEEAAARKVAEEAAARKAAEEAAARKAKEEATAKRAAEEASLFAPDKGSKEAHPVMEPILDNLEGNPNDDLFNQIPEARTTPVPAKTKKQQTSVLDYLRNGNTQEQSVTRTIGDTLQQQGEEHSHLRARKVDDLRTVININDKFSFMSDLFHNNMRAYNEFIMRLNSITERQQALDCVDEMAKQYHWDENSPAVKNFYKVFDRKF